jgi:hypothetical protein
VRDDEELHSGGGPNSVEGLGRGRSAWALVLNSGEQCTKIIGGTRTPRGGLPQEFECERGAVIAGDLDDRRPVWTANYFPPDSSQGETVKIRDAWL